MIDRRDISYTEGSPLTPISAGKLVVKPVDSTPLIKSGSTISYNKPKKPKVVEDPVSNVVDMLKYGPLGLGGPLLATVEHALGKDPTVVSTAFSGATALYGVAGAGAYASATLPAVTDKGIIGIDEQTTLQPEQMQKVIDDVPLLKTIDGTIKFDMPKIDLGLPSFEDLKTPLLIAAGLIGAALFLPSIIGAFKK